MVGNLNEIVLNNTRKSTKSFAVLSSNEGVMKINTILALKFIMTQQTVSISIYLESWDISFISRFSETSHLDTSLKTATNLKAKLSIAKALIQFCFAQLSDLTILHLAPFLVFESEKSS